MGKYNVVDRNGFARQNLNLQDAIDNGSWLPWLEDILKWCLMALYAVLPNYGIAIILLTLIVKLLTFPLTKKSSEAQVRMQAFQPKIQELQAKYKGDPQKLNQEMAALYQKEGYNPLSGCLPILIQIPLFFAMYSLFNNHFDLRGAMFIPGWIPDLSQAEFVWAFEPINFVIWKLSAIRLLPIIYLGSQLIYGKMTQQPTGQSAGQMKFMMYGMPVLFFFMLYDVPSGLLVYWIASNMFQVGQQLIIKKFMGKGNDSGGMKKVGETVLQGKKGKK
jgi:YidC/Oxa1 family membrane protein insertase